MHHLHPGHESKEKRKSAIHSFTFQRAVFLRQAHIHVMKFKITSICICMSQCCNKCTKEIT